jgi:AraC-like DNA-binding protein
MPPTLAISICDGNHPQPHHPRSDARLPARPRRLDTWLLVAVDAGTLVLHLDQRRLTLRPGSVALLQPGQLLASEDVRASYRFLSFTVAAAPRQPDALGGWGVTLPAVLPPDEASNADIELRWCCDRWWRDPAGRLLTEARVGLLLARLLAARLDGQDTADRFARIESEARRRIPTGFSVDDMAAGCRLPRSTFCERYRAARGEAPGSFLRRERLELARGLLPEPGWSIERIARHVGYAGVPTFTRAFRAHYGMAPRSWAARRGRL